MKILISLSSQFALNDRVAWLNDDGTYNIGTVTHYKDNNRLSVEFDSGFKLPSIAGSQLVKLPNNTKKNKKDISKEQLAALLK